MISKKNKIIFFDMDGVLVKYVPEHYRGEDPIYFHKGSHFFQHLQADLTACAVFKMLFDDGYNCYIHSRISEPDGCVEEHTEDKMIWCHEHLPEIPDSRIILSTKSKTEALKDHDLVISKNSILVDDFNRNLNDWNHAGGTSVKYLNGINSASSFDGLTINSKDPVLQIKNFIERI